MLKYQLANGGNFPRIFCDICTSPLKEAIVFWNGEGEIRFTCKHERCSRVAEADGFIYSETLAMFFFQLLGNCDITPERLKECEGRFEFLQGYGLAVVTSKKKLDK